jgi:toxin ParE1/3/4
MRMAELRLTSVATNDLENIKEYISETLCNPIAAQRTVKKIVDDYTLLKVSPFMGAPLSSKVAVKTDYRYLVSGNYIVFYKADENYVSIYRILYGRRDYIKILFGNFTNDEE